MAVLGLLDIFAGPSTPLSALAVEYSPSAVNIYVPILGTLRSQKCVISRTTATAQDVFCWADTPITANTPVGWIVDGLARRAGEQEFALSINATLGGSVVTDGSETFVGGRAHGREVLDEEPVAKVDGVTLDTTGSGTVSGAVATVKTVSTVYEIGTTNPILTKETTLTFDFATAKVTMEVTLTCIGTTASLVAPEGFVARQFYVGMDCGAAGIITKGYMSPLYAEMDITDQSGEVSVTAGLGDEFMIGPKYGMRCRMLSGFAQSTRREIINDAISTNNPKVYHNLTGPDVMVNVGDILTASVEWTFASAGIVTALLDAA